MRVSLFLLFLALCSSSPAYAQSVPDEEDLSVQAFLKALETSVAAMDRAQWTALLSPSIDPNPALEFFDAMVPQGITRVVLKERDRSSLQGTLPGEGFRMILEVF